MQFFARRSPTSHPAVPRSWPWTRRLARLGFLGATVLGAVVALLRGGVDGNAMLLAWTFGLPFSFPLAWLPAFGLNVQGTAAAAWGWSHLLLAAATVASWTSYGLVIDLVRHRIQRPPAAPPALADARDPYLVAAEAEVEALLAPPRLPERDPGHRDGLRRLLSNVALKLTGLRYGVVRAPRARY